MKSKLIAMNNVNKLTIVRLLLGIYFVYLLIFLFQIKELVYLNPDAPSAPTYFFNSLIGQLSEIQINSIFALASMASLLFVFGIFQQLNAILMYLSLLVLIHANFLLMEIHYTYLGWMLVVFFCTPQFTNNYLNDTHKLKLNWWADKLTYSAMFVLGASFTFLGIVKLKYPYYYSPVLSDFLFSAQNAHPHNIGQFNFLNNFLKQNLSDEMKIALGLMAAWVETITLPLLLLKRTRRLALMLIFLVLLYISFFINYWNITLVMMLFLLMATDLRLKVRPHN